MNSPNFKTKIGRIRLSTCLGLKSQNLVIFSITYSIPLFGGGIMIQSTILKDI